MSNWNFEKNTKEFKSNCGSKPTDETFILCYDCKKYIQSWDNINERYMKPQWDGYHISQFCTDTTDTEDTTCYQCDDCYSEASFLHFTVCEEWYRQHRTRKDKRHYSFECELLHTKHSKPKQDK